MPSHPRWFDRSPAPRPARRGGKGRPPPGAPLEISALEGRLVPTTMPSPVSSFDYRVGNPVPGALVVVTGENGISGPHMTNAQGIATISNPPDPSPGITGTAMWGADVVLPPGYDFY